MGEQIYKLQQRIEELEKSVSELQLANKHIASDQHTVIKSPVRIVDENDAVLLELDTTKQYISMKLFGPNGQHALVLGVDGEGGYLSIFDNAGTKVAYLNVELSGARLVLDNHERTGGLVLFGGDSGDDNGGGIHIEHTSGEIAIGLWATQRGGELTFYSTETGEAVLNLPDSPAS